MELSFADELEDRGKCNLFKEELDGAKSSLNVEMGAWDDERKQLQEDVQLEESQLQAMRIEYEHALSERKQLETQHSEAGLRAQELAQQLVNTEAETVSTTEQWQAVLNATDAAKRDSSTAVNACDERLELTKLEILKLQAEDAKLQDRRGRDVRDLRNRLRAQVVRQESEVQRLERSVQDDHAQWEKKLQQSEARTAKLESDVQATRKTLQSIPPKAAAIEAENAEILAKCEVAEGRLRQADEAESIRRSELARLRNTLAELQRVEESWRVPPAADFAAPPANFAMPVVH